MAYRDRCGNCCYRTEYVRTWVSTPVISTATECCVAVNESTGAVLRAETAKPAVTAVATARQ